MKARGSDPMLEVIADIENNARAAAAENAWCGMFTFHAANSRYIHPAKGFLSVDAACVQMLDGEQFAWKSYCERSTQAAAAVAIAMRRMHAVYQRHWRANVPIAGGFINSTKNIVFDD